MAVKDMEEELKKLYWTDSYMYNKKVDMYKKLGYRIYRSPTGEHKIENSNIDFFNMFFDNGSDK